MSIRPHPQSFEQAFQFGEAVVLLNYHAVYRWIHVPDIDPPVPVIVDTCFGRLRDLVERLRRVIPSRARPRLCNRLIDQLQNAWLEYCSCWDSAAHREAIIALQRDESGLVIEELIGQAPVLTESWNALRQMTDDFVEELPPVLRDLSRLGELISKGLWGDTADLGSDPGRAVSFQQFLTVTLEGRLRQKLRVVHRRLPAVRGIACDLYGLDSHEAVLRLKAIRSQVLAAIQQYAEDLAHLPDQGSKRATEHIQSLPRRTAELAWQSYNYAIERMHPSESSARATDQAVWDWLSEVAQTENVLRDYPLPTFVNWSRYLRLARNFYSPDRDPRIAQRTGRSTGCPDEVYAGRS